MATIRALILDVGEVLVHGQPPALVAEMARAAGASLAAFEAAYWAHRGHYDLGGDAQGYWRAVLQACGSALAAADREAAVGRLLGLDARSWTVYREELWTLAKEFRAAGGRLGLLSNYPRPIMDLIRVQRRLAETFDAVVVSAEVGQVKPDPAIFSLTLTRLGVPPGETLFVDDRVENVAAAAAGGMQVLLFTGEESLPALRARLDG
jgi:putative hydrolase of the HAD superfamily